MWGKNETKGQYVSKCITSFTSYYIYNSFRLACTILSMDFMRISKWFKQFINEFKKNQSAMKMSLLFKNKYSLNIIYFKVVL